MNHKQIVETLDAVIDRWNMDSIREDWPSSADDLPIVIGVVGEYSCGKSTLLNALLDEPDLLPRQLKPTTGVATLIEPSIEITANTRVLFQDDMKIAEVTHELWTSAIEQGIGMTPVVQTPVSDRFAAGFLLVDTPGIGSLNRGHHDRLSTMISHMHGAIVCLDAQRGTLTEPTRKLISELMGRLEPEFIALVLTHADQMDPDDLEHVQAHVTKEFGTLLKKAGADLRARVVTASGDPRQIEVGAVVEMLRGTFYAMRTVMERKALEQARLGLLSRVLEQLANIQESLTGTEAELGQKLQSAYARIDESRRQLTDAERIVHTSVSNLRHKLQMHARPHLMTARDATDGAGIRAALSEFDAEFLRIVKEFGNEVGPSLSTLSTRLVHEAERAADLGRKVSGVAHAAIMAFALPGSTVPANLLEGLALPVANAVGRLGLLEGEKNAGASDTPSEETPGTSEKKSRPMSGVRAFFGAAGRIMNDLGEASPISMLANWGADKLRESRVGDLLLQRFDNAVALACEGLEVRLNYQHLGPAKEALSDSESALKEVEIQRTQGLAHVEERLDLLARDLAELRLAKLQLTRD